MEHVWARRADAAEQAVVERHLGPLYCLPGTTLGVVGWPPTRQDCLFKTWHYWWQAHLVDCMVDAATRRPTPARRRRLQTTLRAVWLRNLGRWTNDYYDDMAWLGLAIERSLALHGVGSRAALGELERTLLAAWQPSAGGGIPWRRGDDFFNAPANGPAAILLARTGRLWRAVEMADWLDAQLRDPDSGLILDGVRRDGAFERALYTYCQGVVLGVEVELAVRTGQPRHGQRVHALVRAVADRMAPGQVLRTHGGGDGGLFSGILARYLALVATALPGDDPGDRQARHTARALVLDSAEAAWANAAQVGGLPLFGRKWDEPATVPVAGTGAGSVNDGAVGSSAVAERDLSVQLSGWMLMEAAHSCA